MRRRRVNVLSDPELLELLGHDPELLAIADAIAETQREEQRQPRRGMLLLAAAVAALLLVAVPAIAAFTPLIDFRGASHAPAPVVKRFSDLERQAPPTMDPRVIAAETRKLELPLDGTTITVYIAPTRTGGYCFEVAGHGGGCNADRGLRADVGFPAPRGTTAPALAYGSALGVEAVTAALTAADGTEQETRLTRVSAPIDAAFFAARIDNPERQLPITVQIRDGAGKPIATRTIPRPPTP